MDTVVRVRRARALAAVLLSGMCVIGLQREAAARGWKHRRVGCILFVRLFGADLNVCVCVCPCQLGLPEVNIGRYNMSGVTFLLKYEWTKNKQTQIILCLL